MRLFSNKDNLVVIIEFIIIIIIIIIIMIIDYNYIIISILVVAFIRMFMIETIFLYDCLIIKMHHPICTCYNSLYAQHTWRINKYEICITNDTYLLPQLIPGIIN